MMHRGISIVWYIHPFPKEYSRETWDPSFPRDSWETGKSGSRTLGFPTVRENVGSRMRIVLPFFHQLLIPPFSIQRPKSFKVRNNVHGLNLLTSFQTKFHSLQSFYTKFSSNSSILFILLSFFFLQHIPASKQLVDHRLLPLSCLGPRVVVVRLL